MMDKDLLFSYIFIVLLALLFMIGLQKTYDKGVYDALNDVCKDLKPGIDKDGYTCYNASESFKTPNTYYVGVDDGS